MDPDPNLANLLRTLFVANSRSWGKAAFYDWRWGWVKILEQKKRSFGQFLILIRIQDLDPDSNPDSKLTSGRIRIRNRIRNKSFGSATLLVRYLYLRTCSVNLGERWVIVAYPTCWRLDERECRYTVQSCSERRKTLCLGRGGGVCTQRKPEIFLVKSEPLEHNFLVPVWSVFRARKAWILGQSRVVK